MEQMRCRRAVAYLLMSERNQHAVRHRRVGFGTKMILSFFFQAEDGIRDLTVTGVQTCALPISDNGPPLLLGGLRSSASRPRAHRLETALCQLLINHWPRSRATFRCSKGPAFIH